MEYSDPFIRGHMICVCVKNKYLTTLSIPIDFPSRGNSQGDILAGFQVIYFQQRSFVQWQCCRKVRLTLQRNQIYVKAVSCCVLT